MDIEGRQSDFKDQIELFPLDVDGEQVFEVEVEPPIITVTVPVKQTIKTRDIPVVADVMMETLAEDFEITGIRLSKPSITLIGEDFANYVDEERLGK